MGVSTAIDTNTKIFKFLLYEDYIKTIPLSII